jgi:hypothetical protein
MLDSAEVSEPHSARLGVFRVAGGILAGIVLFALVSIAVGNRNFEEAALDRQTKSLFGIIDGSPVHCMDMRTIPSCVAACEAASAENVVLWLGNSQLHAVNQLSEGQQTSALLLHRKLAKKQQFLTVWSQPNANLQEHYLVYTWATQRLPIKTLILPLVFDDLRENGIRDDLKIALQDLGTRGQLEKSAIGRDLTNLSGSPDSPTVVKTTQDRVEAYLNERLGEIFPSWARRPQIRGEILLQLFFLRNWAFNIKPSDIRRVIPATRTRNVQALEAILADARERGVRVLIYIAPIRNDVPLPYAMAEYDQFKTDALHIADAHGATLLNLENLVHAPLWGLTDSTNSSGTNSIDFMHFQAGGHELLADALFQKLEPSDTP